MNDPVCRRPKCDATNHCDLHDEAVHHCVDSLVEWCRTKARARLEVA